MRSSQAMAGSGSAGDPSAFTGCTAKSNTRTVTSAVPTNLTFMPTGTIIETAPNSITAAGTDQAGIAYRTAPGAHAVVLRMLKQILAHLLQLFFIQALRSEERRVGKECRSRWSVE